MSLFFLLFLWFCVTLVVEHKSLWLTKVKQTLNFPESRGWKNVEAFHHMAHVLLFQTRGKVVECHSTQSNCLQTRSPSKLFFCYFFLKFKKISRSISSKVLFVLAEIDLNFTQLLQPFWIEKKSLFRTFLCYRFKRW